MSLMTATSSNLVEDAKLITRSLLQSRQALHSTVAQADLAAQALSQDGILLKESLHEHQVNLKSGLQLTSAGLNKLKSAENREKRNLLLSLLFFFSVVLYIILRRTRVISLIYATLSAALWSKSLISNMTQPSMHSVPVKGYMVADILQANIESIKHMEVTEKSDESVNNPVNGLPADDLEAASASLKTSSVARDDLLTDYVLIDSNIQNDEVEVKIDIDIDSSIRNDSITEPLSDSISLEPRRDDFVSVENDQDDPDKHIDTKHDNHELDEERLSATLSDIPVEGDSPNGQNHEEL